MIPVIVARYVGKKNFYDPYTIFIPNYSIRREKKNWFGSFTASEQGYWTGNSDYSLEDARSLWKDKKEKILAVNEIPEGVFKTIQFLTDNRGAIVDPSFFKYIRKLNAQSFYEN